jgi:hypothetical protein
VNVKQFTVFETKDEYFFFTPIESMVTCYAKMEG